jgi:tRNA(fMet)-specific endonuclease VapC
MPWLLDTNAVSMLLNRRSASLIRRAAEHPVEQIFLCSVVKAELLYGAWNSIDVSKALAKLDSIFGELTSYPFDDLAAAAFGKIQAHLSATGNRIGPNDTMIAAIALANDLTLVTHNTREFSRVPGLKIEDWQE